MQDEEHAGAVGMGKRAVVCVARQARGKSKANDCCFCFCPAE